MKPIRHAKPHFFSPTPPPSLDAHGLSWPLLDYDAVALQGGADLFTEWMPKLDPRLSFSDEALAEWAAVWAPWVARGGFGRNGSGSVVDASRSAAISSAPPQAR